MKNMELCRKIVILKASNNSILTYNYYYRLMKQIYKEFTEGNSSLAYFVHEHGYRYKSEGRIYKLFTNQLFFKKAEYRKEGICLEKGSISRLTISGEQNIVEAICNGFIKSKTFKLFSTQFEVVEVLDERPARFNNVTIYKVRNPIVVFIQDENGKKLSVNPFEEKFFEILANNLKRKYEIVYRKHYTGELYFDIENAFNIKQKLIFDEATNFSACGYNGFELCLAATKKMQKVAYYCGFGSLNTVGMGCSTFITSREVM